MKLASLRNGARDGRLVAVSRDLARYVPAAEIAQTLQQALDRWDDCEPRLCRLSDELNEGRARSEPFAEADCLSPLPRALRTSAT